MALSLRDRQPRTIAWAPDALTDLVVSGQTVAWYHPASRTLEAAQPDGQVTVLARDINLAATPEIVGDHLCYLCQGSNGVRELQSTSISRAARELRVRLDPSARIVGAASDGLYLGEEEGSTPWFSHPARTGRLHDAEHLHAGDVLCVFVFFVFSPFGTSSANAPWRRAAQPG